MRQVIIQSSIAQNFKANGINNFCYNLKRNRTSFEEYKYIESNNFRKQTFLKVSTDLGLQQKAID